MAFSIDVNSLTGHVCTINVEDTWTVKEVKTSIFEQAGVRFVEQKLLLGADVLENHMPVATWSEGTQLT